MIKYLYHELSLFKIKKNLWQGFQSSEKDMERIDIENLEGQFFALFIIAIAATEVAVAVSIIISLYRRIKSIDVEKVNEMKY